MRLEWLGNEVGKHGNEAIDYLELGLGMGLYRMAQLRMSFLVCLYAFTCS